jgi:hypothetical protein
MAEKTGRWLGETIEDYDWRESSPLSNAFIDLLLLALIRAHPMQVETDRDDFERLRDAKEAVFGIKPSDDRKTRRDIPYLILMAKEYIADRGGGTFQLSDNRVTWGDFDSSRCRGDKTLARDVIRSLKNNGVEFDPMVEESSVISRLARKFKEEKERLVIQVVIHGDIEESFMVGWIDRARELFGPFSIPVSEDTKPARDLKYLF